MSDSSPMSKPQVPSLTFLTTLEKRKDPVCGMMVAAEKAAAKIEHAGNTYYFCSTRCAERFSDEPEKFLAAPGTAGMEQGPARSEEHTSELQSQSNLVCRLLLEKKNKNI